MGAAEPQGPKRYLNLVEAKLWKRLNSGADAEQKNLANNVQKAAREAAILLDQIVTYMPLYTLHSERHSLNVIAWMERLLGPEGIKELSPLELSLCILAAYVHDLGMTLTREEWEDTLNEASDSPARRDYLRFRDGFLGFSRGTRRNRPPAEERPKLPGRPHRKPPADRTHPKDTRYQRAGAHKAPAGRNHCADR